MGSVACSTSDDTLDKKDEIAFSLTKVTDHFNESLEFVFNISSLNTLIYVGYCMSSKGKRRVLS